LAILTDLIFIMLSDLYRLLAFCENEPTIYITCDAADMHSQSKTSLTIICNNQAESVFKGRPNLVVMKGIENLTEIDIALAKFLRTLDPSNLSNRRVCIDILSDVLLQHKAVTSRKWLSGLLLNLKANSFTVLAVIDPKMHSPEDLQAILSLFDGEIMASEKDSHEGTKKTLRVNKLYGEKYLKEEIGVRMVFDKDYRIAGQWFE